MNLLEEMCRELAGRGVSQKTVYLSLDAMAGRYTEMDSERDEILEAMDAVVGWCPPHRKIYPDGTLYPGEEDDG